MKMAEKQLHPSVKQFKEFVKKNPKLIKEVRNGATTWQDLYEEWYLLGEDDSRWDPFREGDQGKDVNKDKKKEENKTGDWVSKMLDAVKSMDSEQIQGQINHLSQALGAIQGVLTQFQGKPTNNQTKSEGSPPPFSFRKD